VDQTRHRFAGTFQPRPEPTCEPTRDPLLDEEGLDGQKRGPNPPNSAFGDKRSEGAMLDVPGVINFNHTAGGDNVIIQTG
jgi:hypothetical protein